MAKTQQAGAPGPDVVEALASPLFAQIVNAGLTEAADALKARYLAPAADGHEPPALTPTQAKILDAIASLGAQLVTATTAPTEEGPR